MWTRKVLRLTSSIWGAIGWKESPQNDEFDLRSKNVESRSPRIKLVDPGSTTVESRSPQIDQFGLGSKNVETKSPQIRAPTLYFTLYQPVKLKRKYIKSFITLYTPVYRVHIDCYRQHIKLS